MSIDRDSYRSIIRNHLHQGVSHTDFALPEHYSGKVRERYRLDEQRLLIITTDRQSAFDRILATIPFKGAVLNLVSAWWFEHTSPIIANHLLQIPHPQIAVVKECSVFPIEFVVRGYITGTTNTSLWTVYNSGQKEYCGHVLPEGLVKNQRLAKPLLTPTTKEKTHDRPISPAEIVQEGWMSQADWDEAAAKALELFAYGQKTALEHGLILVDTKYEFGKDKEGNIILIDEIHTPDSSRYWLADSYESRFASQREPESIDKEFLRLWFAQNSDPYHDKELPVAPEELVVELSLRYIILYEMITGKPFPFPSGSSIEQAVSDIIKEASK
ncbi:MAG: phosphoribosylaminoimidazolesuccinocarboxamide synthase [Sphaerochaetaceae bacterium]|jgi:phosphoribosylaminoimidazole-succinocarboxamide synthase